MHLFMLHAVVKGRRQIDLRSFQGFLLSGASFVSRESKDSRERQRIVKRLRLPPQSCWRCRDVPGSRLLTWKLKRLLFDACKASIHESFDHTVCFCVFAFWRMTP